MFLVKTVNSQLEGNQRTINKTVIKLEGNQRTTCQDDLVFSKFILKTFEKAYSVMIYIRNSKDTLIIKLAK